MVFPVAMYRGESWTLRRPSTKNWCFKIVALEKTRESPLEIKEIKPVNPKGNQPWIFMKKGRCWNWSSNTLVTWCKELTHWERLWYWERLRAGREGGERGGDDCMESPTQCTWVWANSGIWWRTGKAGTLQPMGSQSQTWLSNWITTAKQL